MKKMKVKLPTQVLVLCSAAFLTAAPLTAQQSSSAASERAEAEMEAAFGTVPVMFELYPQHMRADAWEWFRASMSSEAAIPAKYMELIQLGVAAQIPCDYCVYAHTTMAKALGATDAEVRAAVAGAAATRHWSTVLNGAGVPFDEFKKEWDGILAYSAEKSEAE